MRRAGLPLRLAWNFPANAANAAGLILFAFNYEVGRPWGGLADPTANLVLNT